MTIHPSITFEQHQSDAKAIRARMNVSKSDRIPASLLAFVIGVAFVIILIHPDTRAAGIGLLAAAAILWGYIQKLYRERIAAARRRDLDRMQPVLNGNQMTINSTGIRGTWVGDRAGYDFRWQAFEEVLDFPDRLLFLYAPCCYIRVPKDELSPADLVDVLAWYKQSKESDI